MQALLDPAVTPQPFFALVERENVGLTKPDMGPAGTYRRQS